MRILLIIAIVHLENNSFIDTSSQCITNCHSRLSVMQFEPFCKGMLFIGKSEWSATFLIQNSTN